MIKQKQIQEALDQALRRNATNHDVMTNMALNLNAVSEEVTGWEHTVLKILRQEGFKVSQSRPPDMEKLFFAMGLAEVCFTVKNAADGMTRGDRFKVISQKANYQGAKNE